MNKQEAIREMNKTFPPEGFTALSTLVLYSGDIIDLKSKLTSIINKIEPEKMVIPRFVAEWIKKCKTFKNFAVSLSFALQPSAWEANRLSDECIEWLTDAENQDIFARAWLDGYDVEQEKLYTVEIPNPNAVGYSIALGRKEGKVYIRQFVSPTWQMSYSNQLTEAEIKQDFDWAWQWAKPAEVQEAE